MWVERPRYVKVYKSREDGSLWYHQLNAQEAHPFNPDETVFYLEKDVDALMAGIDIVIEDKVKFLEESTEAWKKEFAEKADEKLREKEEFMVEMLQIATKKFVEQELCDELTDANKEAIKFLISEAIAQVEDKLKRGEEEMKVKVKGPKNPDLKPDTHEYFHTVPLCDRQFCMTYWNDKRVHKQVVQLIPRCPACAEPYSIEVDGSDVKDVTPGQISTGKCVKCGREFKYILFRAYYADTPDIPIFNGFTIKEEIK